MMAKRDSQGRTMKERIWALTDGKRTDKDIAAMIGCHPAYVRAAWSRAQGTKRGDLRKAYFESWEDRKRRKQRGRRAA